MAGERHGQPQEEMFMDDPTSNQPNTPTVGPLRINKSPATSPAPRPGQGASEQQPTYPASYTQPSSPPPNRPLPYPDDRNRPQPGASQYQSGYSPPPNKGGARYQSPPVNDSNARYPSPSARQRTTSPRTHEQRTGTPQHMASPGRTKPLPESPGPDTPDKDGYSQSMTQSSLPSGIESPSQYYYPPPGGSSSAALRIPDPAGVNRLASTSSVSTTKAARGSPPPPETPVVEPVPGGIEARYAAAGIAGASTLSSLQAHNLAAQQARQHGQQAPAAPSQAQGPEAQTQFQPPPQSTGLEQDMQNLQAGEEPPPAYSSVPGLTQGYPADKRRPSNQVAGLSVSTNAPAAAPAAAPNVPTIAAHAPPGHPAFISQAQQSQPVLHQPQPSTAPSQASSTQATPQQNPSPAPSQSSPPPLPEGWIAHLDPNSGQYYYIHLPTQATQWEFPKGPTPLNLNGAPSSPTGTIASTNPFASPTASTFGGKPLASPGIPHRESIMTTMSAISSPTAAGFHVPPPAAGVDMYRVAPTNGVYFGPYLRYTNMDVDNGYWYGSILLVTDAPHPPTIHLHQSSDLSPNPRQLKANHIHTHQRWSFYRYDIDIRMEEDHEAKWTYAITSHLGCTRYEFLVASRRDFSWRFIAHSGNDFAINVNTNERAKVGGIGLMWKDIMQKHQEVGGFHAQLGMGNQIYADRLWKEIPSLRQWTGMSGKENRKNAPWTAQHEEEVTHAYFHYYTSHFDQPHLREAFAQIPHILTLDDHDIFDGFGSYPEHMQFSAMFKNIGRIGIELYLLFQHHTTLDILRHVTNSFDLFTITGTGWHFLKQLGPAVVVAGPDCRSERNPYQVMAGPTYQGFFPKVAMLPPSVQHCIWMIPVPVVYPRLDTAEQFAQTMASGKKAVTGTFNALGKVTAGVAGIVGAKGVVGEGFNSVKKAVGKSGLMSNVLSPFGELDILDELRDQWTHESKDLERTYLIRTLQTLSHQKSLRMSFFSGATNCCGAGLLSDPSIAPATNSHKAMFQIISSSVVNAPPSAMVMRMLHPHLSSSSSNSHGSHSGSSGGSGSSKPLYVPQNGQRSRADGPATDTKEDMLEMFGQDVTGQAREMKRLMGRRNYVAVVSFDPEAVSEAFGQQSQAGSVKDGVTVGGSGSVSLAVDFFVQAEGAAAGAVGAQAGGVGVGMGGGAGVGPVTIKYGPLTIPAVMPGH